MKRDTDKKYMERALELALRGQGHTGINPVVGCVIVKNNNIISEGYHKIFGGRHAEASALLKAGTKAKGAVLYVNLEPCFPFQGKKTPPCVEKIISAGIKRCVIAMKDPNPEINGRSIALLKKNGIKIRLGLFKEEAEKMNAPFLKVLRTGRPLVISKMALSLDGKAAAYTGDSRWISNPLSRTLVHYKRSKYDAVMAGIGTVKIDDPGLNVRRVKGRDPLRVIVDPKCEISLKAKVLKDKKNVLVVVNTGAKKNRIAGLLNAGIRVVSVEGREGTVNLKKTLALLPVFGISSVLLEGGPALLTAALKEKVVDRILWFIAPKILGNDAKSVVGNMAFKTIKKAIAVKDPVFSGLDGDIVVEGRLN